MRVSCLIAGFLLTTFLNSKEFAWSDFQFNSTAEKDFWRDVTDWSAVKGLVNLAQIYKVRRDPKGNPIIDPKIKGFTGYMKIKIGELRTICRIVNGWVTQAKTFHLSGQLLVSSNWKNGKQDGRCFIWYKNGIKKSDANYLNGLRHGLLSVWYENGSRKAELIWKNGKQDGITMGWNNKGIMIAKSSWKDGEMNGENLTWYQSGIQKSKGTFKENKKQYIDTAKSWTSIHAKI